MGKGTLIRGLMERRPELELSVSATTRAPRAGERDGVDYHFLSDEQFERHVRDGDFVEHADYAGRRYGTLRRELESRLDAGVPLVLEIEVQGARQVRRTLPEAVQVFIAPPSAEALRAAWSAAAPTTPTSSSAGWQVAQGELEAQSRVRLPGRQRRPRDRAGRSSNGDRRRASCREARRPVNRM